MRTSTLASFTRLQKNSGDKSPLLKRKTDADKTAKSFDFEVGRNNYRLWSSGTASSMVEQPTRLKSVREAEIEADEIG